MGNKDFDLQRAIAGDPLVTENETKAEFVAYAAHAIKGFRLMALVDGCVYTYYDNGRRLEYDRTGADLFMAPKKVTRWVNILSNHRLFDFAEGAASYAKGHSNYIATAIPVEIEE